MSSNEWQRVPSVGSRLSGWTFLFTSEALCGAVRWVELSGAKAGKDPALVNRSL